MLEVAKRPCTAVLDAKKGGKTDNAGGIGAQKYSTPQAHCTKQGGWGGRKGRRAAQKGARLRRYSALRGRKVR